MIWLTDLPLTEVKVILVGSSHDWLRGDTEGEGNSAALGWIRLGFSVIAGQLSVLLRGEEFDWVTGMLFKYSLGAEFEIISLEEWEDSCFLCSVNQTLIQITLHFTLQVQYVDIYAQFVNSNPGKIVLNYINTIYMSYFEERNHNYLYLSPLIYSLKI